GALLGLEPQSRAVAGEAQQARGVIEKAALVQDAQAPGLEVLERVRRRAELGSAGTGEANGDSVDGEVPAPKVIVGAAGAHIGQEGELRFAAGAQMLGVAVVLRVDVCHHAAARTGTPPAARCALVSAMVCHP